MLGYILFAYKMGILCVLLQCWLALRCGLPKAGRDVNVIQGMDRRDRNEILSPSNEMLHSCRGICGIRMLEGAHNMKRMIGHQLYLYTTDPSMGTSFYQRTPSIYDTHFLPTPLLLH